MCMDHWPHFDPHALRPPRIFVFLSHLPLPLPLPPCSLVMVPERFTGQIKSIHSARVGSETKKTEGGEHTMLTVVDTVCILLPPSIVSETH